MSDTNAESVLGVGMTHGWRRAVRIRLEDFGAVPTFVDEYEDALRALPTGDYDGVITMGLDGDGIKVARFAAELGMRAVLISASRIAVQQVESDGGGIRAFHTNRLLNAYGLDPIIEAAVGRRRIPTR
jgi:hypothetical protein